MMLRSHLKPKVKSFDFESKFYNESTGSIWCTEKLTPNKLSIWSPKPVIRIAQSLKINQAYYPVKASIDDKEIINYYALAIIMKYNDKFYLCAYINREQNHYNLPSFRNSKSDPSSNFSTKFVIKRVLRYMNIIDNYNEVEFDNNNYIKTPNITFKYCGQFCIDRYNSLYKINVLYVDAKECVTWDSNNLENCDERFSMDTGHPKFVWINLFDNNVLDKELMSSITKIFY